jgi:hypothetical protein
MTAPKLTTTEAIEQAGAERARQLPPMTREQAERLAPQLSAGLHAVMERRAKETETAA